MGRRHGRELKGHFSDDAGIRQVRKLHSITSIITTTLNLFFLEIFCQEVSLNFWFVAFTSIGNGSPQALAKKQAPLL